MARRSYLCVVEFSAEHFQVLQVANHGILTGFNFALSVSHDSAYILEHFTNILEL